MGTLRTLAFAALLVVLPLSTEAASLYLSPESGSHAPGSSFTLTVYAESADEAMNAASGRISFPWSTLEVISLSKAGSIFSLWAEEPSFSNSAGTVAFEGVVLNPGYTGTGGKLLSITFRAKRSGEASIRFASGSVLANDGAGSNILDEMRGATVAISGGSTSEVKSTPTTVPGALTGSALTITSATHPEQERWYVHDSPEFEWVLPSGTKEIRTRLSTSPSLVPSVSYIPPIEHKKLAELADGTYYFALQARTAGGWGPIARYRINIDTTPPKPFVVTFPNGSDGWNPRPSIFFSTSDEHSGIQYYDILVEETGETMRIAPPTAADPFVLPAQFPGLYTVVVTAVDGAGNKRSSSAVLSIDGIDAPAFTEYPSVVGAGDDIKIRGTTYPDARVSFYIWEGNKLVAEEETGTNVDGIFVHEIDTRLGQGVYTVTARATDERGARSYESAPATITIQPNFLFSVFGFIIRYLSIAILVLLGIAGIVLLGAYLYTTIPLAIYRMRQEAREAGMVSDKVFETLRADIRKHIEKLRYAQRERSLTNEELEFLEQFEKNLKKAEESIGKEIRDIR